MLADRKLLNLGGDPGNPLEIDASRISTFVTYKETKGNFCDHYRTRDTKMDSQIMI